MAGVSGISFLLAIYDGVSTYNNLGGQRNATLNLNAGEAETTSKDSSGWRDAILTTRDWSIDFDGILLEANTAFGDLEDAWLNNTSIQIQFATAAANTYAGTVNVSSLSYDTPYDGEASISGTLNGITALTKT